MQLETSIGLEVHVQLLTDTKLFCICLNKYGRDPNVNVCPICMGLPVALPVLNNNAVDFVLKSALALNSNILQEIQFSRKTIFILTFQKDIRYHSLMPRLLWMVILRLRSVGD